MEQRKGGKKKARTEDLVKEKLIENYARYYRLAYSYARTESDAQDIVQEGAYKAILNCDSLKNPEYAQTWIYRIMVNEALSFLRKRSRSSVSMDEAAEVSFTDRYQDLDLRKAVEELPAAERTVIILRYFEDLKLEQIAEITRENINTVKTRLYRTLKKLNVALTDRSAGESV